MKENPALEMQAIDAKGVFETTFTSFKPFILLLASLTDRLLSHWIDIPYSRRGAASRLSKRTFTPTMSTQTAGNDDHKSTCRPFSTPLLSFSCGTASLLRKNRYDACATFDKRSSFLLHTNSVCHRYLQRPVLWPFFAIPARKSAPCILASEVQV